MHIQKLRLVGFKSFVEPTDLVIEEGLTGVVGPNGCGKSNLLEALRWVMGESSYKSMRASAMDDVIFSGTVTRPARNSAEVTIFIDNSKRTAPVEFNDTDEIEITRRIEREAGSAYRINGREARARDIKILFEDAATGARSPALVRQGQIGEIVNAKPEQRRRILEDAAGIAGLHSRRHEAELRLKAAENNLARIGDILGQLKSQLDGLKRQARQARRYAELSDQIRKTEAIVFHLTWVQAQAEVTAEEAALQHALQELGIATQQEAEIIRLDADLSAKMQPLRDAAMVRSTVLTRQRHELEKLTGEAERITARQTELAAQSERLAQDREREAQLIEEAKQQGQQLTEELAGLETEATGDVGRSDELKSALATAESELTAAEADNNAVQKKLSDHRSEERSLSTLLNERRTRHDRLAAQIQSLDDRLTKAAQERPDSERFDELGQTVEQLTAVIEQHEETLAECETAIQAALQQQQGARDHREQALVALRSLEAEQRTLVNLLQSTTQSFPPVLDQISVASGLETALASALGDDIEAALDAEAPVYWEPSPAAASHTVEPPSGLPTPAQPLLDFVEAPAALHKRLGQVGLVDASAGARLQAELRPGQRLVSKAGDLWRWDGLVARADAPSPAAQRLAGRNRLKDIKNQLEAAATAVETADDQATAASEALQTERSREQSLRQSLRQDRDTVSKLQAERTTLERKLSEFDAQLEATRSTRALAETDRNEVAKQLDEAETALRQLADVKQLELEAANVTTTMRTARDKAAELKAAVAGMEREKQRLRDRIERVRQDIKGWQARADQSEQRLKTVAHDLEALAVERKTLAERPEELDQAREKLRMAITVSEGEYTEAGDAVAKAEMALREAAVELRERTTKVAEQRENRARADARLEGARQKRADIVQTIHDALETTPEGCLQVAEITADAASDSLPSLSDADAKLAKLRADRERLGGVNLQAERELSDLEDQHGSLDHERADVEEAIAKLRAGIASLNREGRKRLKEAFVTVDGHFQTLFQTLFNGGEARLSMIESDEDPLAGGLEIIAKPPGKKPTTLSLLSGGEQTLTALSLIFAVFLTNPSPICVLDEVDAPLDDSNVDRFCRMMEKMSSDTDTRFLCITHHPETMARMDRLFGVTMGEKGVSQLVSVDLQMAERFLEAG